MLGWKKTSLPTGSGDVSLSKHLVLPQPTFRSVLWTPTDNVQPSKVGVRGLQFNGLPQYHCNTATLREKTLLHPLKYSCYGRVHVPIATLFSVPCRSLETLMGSALMWALFIIYSCFRSWKVLNNHAVLFIIIVLTLTRTHRGHSFRGGLRKSTCVLLKAVSRFKQHPWERSFKPSNQKENIHHGVVMHAHVLRWFRTCFISKTRFTFDFMFSFAINISWGSQRLQPVINMSIKSIHN